jgi:hypothetical protein
MKKMLTVCGLALGLAAASTAFAKLPAPPSTPEAKLKAAETAAKTAWTGKVDAYKLCQSQDKVAAGYRASAAAAGKQLPPAPAVPACADPGTFAFVPPAEQKPIEAAGAHSPAATAAAPPSTTQPAAATNPTPKQ